MANAPERILAAERGEGPHFAYDDLKVDAETMTEDEVDGTAFTEEELAIARARKDPHKIVTTRPSYLGYASITLIIVNRMIGTGIFRTPTTLAHGTHSIVYPLVFWAIGGVVAICGTHVYAEYALTVPLLKVEGDIEVSVPRNGGEKNYLEYLIKSPERFATCLFGIPFIILGTMAGNALICAECLYRACGAEPSGATVRGIALGITAFSCLVHAGWRRGGIYLFNIFGTVKVGMMLTMILLGLVFALGGLGGSADVARNNLSIHHPIASSQASVYGHAEAFLAVIFAFGGFNQANYVLGEIDHPRRKFKRTTISTVVVVAVLYILVNLSYMVVVPDFEQFQKGSDTVAAIFFLRLFGPGRANKVQNSFMAFSSFGNLLVQTFTASRVKQEISKEFVVPFAKFFASNRSLTPRFLRGKRWDNREISDATPVGALVLHFFFSLLLIMATFPATISDSYRIYVSLYSWVVDAFFGFCIGLGMLVLRMRTKAQWSKKSTSNKYVSIGTATIFTLANCFPLIAVWIPPPNNPDIALPIKWWATGTIGTIIIGFSIFYWLALRYVVPRILGVRLDVQRQFYFKKSHGYWVIWHEVTSGNWRTRFSYEHVGIR